MIASEMNYLAGGLRIADWFPLLLSSTEKTAEAPPQPRQGVLRVFPGRSTAMKLHRLSSAREQLEQTRNKCVEELDSVLICVTLEHGIEFTK
jgi:hypothetical protein